MSAKPATPSEAEELAKKAVGEYLTACRIAGTDDREAMGNYLMKLCSVAGVVMAHAQGRQIAAERLAGTAAYIHNTMPEEPAQLRQVQ